MRTFLLTEMPDPIGEEKPTQIKTGYISRSKDKKVVLGKRDNHHFLSITQSDGDCDGKYEISLSQKDFNTLWPSTAGYRLEKEIWMTHEKGRPVIINRFAGHLSGLLTGEVLISPDEQRETFLPPSYFGEELSFDSRFSAENLCSMDYGNIKDILSLEKPGHYPLIGTIPYRFEKGKLQILLVTTRSNGAWIYPKGQPIRKKNSMEVALQESYEEAGIKGLISGHPVIASYRKNRGTYTMILFPMEIQELLNKWPEDNERKREFFSIKEASQKIKQPGLQEPLRYFEYMKY